MGIGARLDVAGQCTAAAHNIEFKAARRGGRVIGAAHTNDSSSLTGGGYTRSCPAGARAPEERSPSSLQGGRQGECFFCHSRRRDVTVAPRTRCPDTGQEASEKLGCSINVWTLHASVMPMGRSPCGRAPAIRPSPRRLHLARGVRLQALCRLTRSRTGRNVCFASAVPPNKFFIKQAQPPHALEGGISADRVAITARSGGSVGRPSVPTRPL